MQSTLQNNILKQQIAERRKVEEKLRISEEHFKLLVEGVKDYAIFFTDTAGKIIYWNTGAKKLIGYKAAEILGKNFSKLFTIEDRKINRPERELETVVKTGRADDNNWLLKKDKSQIWVSGVSTAVKSKEGDILYIAKIVHDLTSYKELEERKNDFISMASHELRTPVTSIKVFLQILQKRSEKLPDPMFNQILVKTGNQVNNLVLLIDDLLDASKIQSKRLQMQTEEFYFNDLIEEEVENFQAMTLSHEIILENISSNLIKADMHRIGQVLLNFLTNAVKYSPDSDKVFVKVFSNKNNVICSVQDFGIGISKSNQKKVFDRFFRASGKEEKTFPGIGLGLFVAFEIIKRHKGKIWLESNEGKGSTFFFSLPKKL